MKAFIVYCHPSKTSITNEVKEEFIRGLKKAGHEYILSDLYAMDFNGVLSEEEYVREAFYRSDIPVASDVLAEQEKIQASDALVFIYPVFWTEAPAKLIGWFDRVYSSGFAYAPNPTMKVLEKALCIAIAGKSLETLQETGEADAMRTVMLGDRIRNRAKNKELVILPDTTRWNEEIRNGKRIEHIKKAYDLGFHLFDFAR